MLLWYKITRANVPVRITRRIVQIDVRNAVIRPIVEIAVAIRRAGAF